MWKPLNKVVVISTNMTVLGDSSFHFSKCRSRFRIIDLNNPKKIILKESPILSKVHDHV